MKLLLCQAWGRKVWRMRQRWLLHWRREGGGRAAWVGIRCFQAAGSALSLPHRGVLVLRGRGVQATVLLARRTQCRALPAATRAEGQRPAAPAAVRSIAARSVVARSTPLCCFVRLLQVGPMLALVRVLLGQPLLVLLVLVVLQRRGRAGENGERRDCDCTERKGSRAGGPTPSATPRCCLLIQHLQRSHCCRGRTIARADFEEEHRAKLQATRC